MDFLKISQGVLVLGLVFLFLSWVFLEGILSVLFGLQSGTLEDCGMFDFPEPQSSECDPEEKGVRCFDGRLRPICPMLNLLLVSAIVFDVIFLALALLYEKYRKKSEPRQG